MSADIGVQVQRADTDGSLQCPRCWRYWGIPYNPLGVCDRCMEALECHPEWADIVRRSQIEQVYIFRRDLMGLSVEERKKQVDSIMLGEGRTLGVML